MILTRGQEEGLKLAVQRYKDREPYTVISGYAGSGKSTLVKFIIAALGIDPSRVAYACFTGKAATVLRQKGCENAITAHKLLYHAKLGKDGKYKFYPRKELENPYALIVVDEVSMLPKSIWQLLLTYHVPVIALGDPGQLPPVDPADDNHILDKPHVFLDEIMRQAQDSEIIRLSMHVRSGAPLSSFQAEGAQVKILKPKDTVDGLYLWADQILCATNATRIGINNYVRELKGFGEKPCTEDKIISLDNHWGFFSQSGEQSLINGSIGTIEDYDIQNLRLPYYIRKEPIQFMYTNISLDDGDCFFSVPIDYQCLLTGEPTMSGRDKYLLSKDSVYKDLISPPYEFGYAYAITVHKFQGSQAPKILVFEEKFPFTKEEHMKHLYTSCTRAEEKLVVVTKE